MLNLDVLGEFIEDKRLDMRVKLEDYLLVYLGARQCSQVTLPAELPSGAEMGRRIDERIYPILLRVRRGDRGSIEGVKREMRRAYSEVVEASEEYRAHLEWAGRLGLRWLMDEVRPTVREFYLYREKETGRKLRRLMERREKLRRKALRRPKALGVYLAYPEELDVDWVLEMGRLLGYPECCVERYARERAMGVDLELRAKRQLEEGEADAMAYFVSYFFPCSPICPEAIAMGRRCHRMLEGLSPKLGELYRRRVRENLELVRRLPSLVEAHRAEAERRLGEWRSRTRQL